MAQAVWVLLVGIDTYGGQVPALRGCVADVEAVAQFLAGRLGLAAEQICQLTNAAATRPAILDAWQSHLLAPVAPGDQLFFYFSGHGSQAPSIDENEMDGLDETLVAFDSRLPGGSDILDKELGYLIRLAEARGAQVSVLLDCCHSGSGTRQRNQPAVRQVAPRVEQAAADTLLADPAVLLAAAAEPTAHVLLSAAHDDELANEIYLPDSGQWRGAASYFFLEAMQAYRPEMTWAEVHDQVLARVHALYPRQSPQLAGPAGRLLFGGELRPVERYLRVVQSDGAHRIQVDGGAAVGLVPGAVLALYRAGDGMAARPASLAVVEAVEAGTAWAHLETAGTAMPGSRAGIVSYGYRGQTYWVAADDSRVAAQMATAPFLRMATGGETLPAFAVRTTPAGWQIEDATGMPIGAPVAADDEGAARVVAQLEHLAIFRNVSMLRNPAAGARLGAALQIAGPHLAGVADAGMPLTVSSGANVEFSLTNRTAATLYLAIFRLGADYSIVRIKPEAERNLALAPGRAGRVRVLDTAGHVDAGQPYAWLRYKIFVMTERIDLDVLQLPPLDAVAVAGMAPVRADSILGDLLDSVRRTGTRPMRPPASTRDDQWFTLDLEVKVIPPGESAVPPCETV